MTNNNIYRSDETDKLFAAFVKFQGEMGSVTMDSEVKVATKAGDNYSFKYATLAALVEAAKPVLSKNGLGITQILSGKILSTLLVHSSGQFIGSESYILFDPTDPQKYGSLVSYMRRYAYASILGLVSDEDDDGNIASGNDFAKNGSKDIAAHANGDAATLKQVAKIETLMKSRAKKRTETEMVDAINRKYEWNITNLNGLTKSEASQVIEALIGTSVSSEPVDDPAVTIN